jgi:hypothetical protein
MTKVRIRRRTGWPIDASTGPHLPNPDAGRPVPWPVEAPMNQTPATTFATGTRGAFASERTREPDDPVDRWGPEGDLVDTDYEEMKDNLLRKRAERVLDQYREGS